MKLRIGDVVMIDWLSYPTKIPRIGVVVSLDIFDHAMIKVSAFCLWEDIANIANVIKIGRL